MNYYASHTGTKRNLRAMRDAGFRVLISRSGQWSHAGFPYALDNGAWADFNAHRDFDGDKFERLIDRFGAGADWIVLPDIVAGGLPSLEMSIRWQNRCMSVCNLVLIAVQDGMEHSDLAPFVGRSVGIFLGGSTEWKLARMADWGEFCAERQIYYHVARVNTIKRIRMAAAGWGALGRRNKSDTVRGHYAEARSRTSAIRLAIAAAIGRIALPGLVEGLEWINSIR